MGRPRRQRAGADRKGSRSHRSGRHRDPPLASCLPSRALADLGMAPRRSRPSDALVRSLELLLLATGPVATAGSDVAAGSCAARSHAAGAAGSSGARGGRPANARGGERGAGLTRDGADGETIDSANRERRAPTSAAGPRDPTAVRAEGRSPRIVRAWRCARAGSRTPGSVPMAPRRRTPWTSGPSSRTTRARSSNGTHSRRTSSSLPPDGTGVKKVGSRPGRCMSVRRAAPAPAVPRRHAEPRPRPAHAATPQGRSTVEPVVFRPSRSRWAAAASRSG